MQMQFLHPALLLGVLLSALPVRAAEPELTAADLPRVPAKSPVEALSTFQVKPGFRIETAAAEPEVISPIALSFDENGRLFVIEMRDYSERRDERMGRVRMLEDKDGDGRYETSTILAVDLAWPTAIICYDGGVFVGATPDIIYLKDTNGDGVADVRRVVFTGFGEGTEKLNVQALFNGFNWGLDNRIHGASGGNGGRVRRPDVADAKPVDVRGRDFSFDPRTLDFRAETGGGQYGLSYDSTGHKYVCSNSSHIRSVMYEASEAGRNPAIDAPAATIDIAVDGPAAEVYRTSPEEPWRVIRTRWRVTGVVPGMIEGGGRASGYFTGATGIAIYRGDTWPDEFHDDAFVADCGSNLVHRKRVTRDGVVPKAQRSEDELKSEFLTSTDNWFRPVQLANGPDGALYICDMYREVIEHPWSLPPAIKKFIDLNSGNDRGRIYRVVPEHFKRPSAPRLGSMKTSELVAALEQPNGWTRDTAARLLFERRDPAAAPALRRMLTDSRVAQGRLQALCALEGLGALTEQALLAGLRDVDPNVRRHGLRLAAAVAPSAALQEQFGRMGKDPSAEVRFQLAFALGAADFPGKPAILAEMARQGTEDPWMAFAVLSAAKSCAADVFAAFGASDLAAVGAGKMGSGLLATIAAFSLDAALDETARRVAAQDNPGLRFRFADSIEAGLSRARRAAPAETAASLEKIRADAARMALDRGASADLRATCVRMAFRQDVPETRTSLAKLLNLAEPEPVRVAAVRMLTRFASRESAGEVTARWSELTPASRSEAMSQLLTRPVMALLVLDGIREGKIGSGELGRSQHDFLRNHPDATVRARAVAVLGAMANTGREEVVRKYQPALQLSGDAKKGRETFANRCATCHRLAGLGVMVGPDLTSVRGAGMDTLLTSILDPNREVAPRFLNYVVQTTDGDTLSGLILRENESSVVLQEALGYEHVVPRARVKSMESRGKSIMPEGMEDGLSNQDLADLMEFILTAGTDGAR